MSKSAPGYAVSVEDHDNVRVLVLDRPTKLNAFTAEGYRMLKARLDTAAADPHVAVCVLTGRGRAFSAGVDLDEMSRPGGSAALGVDFDPLLDCLARFPKPLVAGVNGLAVGFGATLLLHCDLVVVDDEAQIRMPFVVLGTCAEAGSSWLLPRRVGLQQASWMMLSGAPLTAADAVATGFALARAEAGQAVALALTVAGALAAHNVDALVANKALLRGNRPRITEVWQREKAAMAVMAQKLGPIGWSAPGGRPTRLSSSGCPPGSMTAPTLALLVVAACSRRGTGWRRAATRPLEYLCKPATLVALIATALALTPAPDAGDRASGSSPRWRARSSGTSCSCSPPTGLWPAWPPSSSPTSGTSPGCGRTGRAASPSPLRPLWWCCSWPRSVAESWGRSEDGAISSSRWACTWW